MGYHILTDTNTEKPGSHYINHLDDLLQLTEISDDSFVYAGDAHNHPVRLRNHPLLKEYSDPQWRALRRAELLFDTLSFEHGYLLQRIDQDEKNYARYNQLLGEQSKRSDYLLLNLANIELDVHCLPLKSDGHGQYYLLHKNTIENHVTVMSKVKRRLIFAFFSAQDDMPLVDSLSMMDLNKVLSCEMHGKFYRIPVLQLQRGFSLLDQIRVEVAKDKPVTRHHWLRKILTRVRRTPTILVYLIFLISASVMIYQNFPWLNQFKQEFEIIFICSLSAFLLGRQWR